MHQYPERDEDFEALAYDVINEHEDLIDIKQSEARIAVVKSYIPKRSEGRMIFADIRPVTDLYKALIPFDYVITIYIKNCAMLDDDQMRVLLWHELKHIKIKLGKDGVIFGTVGHDVEDFYDIIDAYGIHWTIEGLDNAKKTDGTGKFGQLKKRTPNKHIIKGASKGDTVKGHKGSSTKEISTGSGTEDTCKCTNKKADQAT